ncbi:hypothetical protein OE88DRAFT_1130662 [Heliocybe sulcata]|uniref:Uncharacterized protein n=1 Tax=Heliocybe sulcata TaxID=5364 RepID=A0A5C3N7X4_9AGAM|nr:hypothetical protein OE88DRAFT_1130662 [Heliocybe sulcata]
MISQEALSAGLVSGTRHSTSPAPHPTVPSRLRLVQPGFCHLCTGLDGQPTRIGPTLLCCFCYGQLAQAIDAFFNLNVIEIATVAEGRHTSLHGLLLPRGLKPKSSSFKMATALAKPVSFARADLVRAYCNPDEDELGSFSTHSSASTAPKFARYGTIPGQHCLYTDLYAKTHAVEQARSLRTATALAEIVSFANSGDFLGLSTHSLTSSAQESCAVRDTIPGYYLSI